MEIDIKSKISNGSFGTVFKVSTPEIKKSRKNLALKVVPHYRGTIKNLLELVLYFNNSPFLIQGLDYEVDKTSYKILMPLAKTNLFDFMRKCKVNFEKEKFKIICDICLGVEYLHRHNIVHGDIKPTNILIMDNPIRAVLTDFSLSGICNNHLKGKAYTIGFQPPENLEHSIYDFKSDIWALGYTIKMMIEPNEVSLMRLAQKMLEPNPELRPNIYEVLHHLLKEDKYYISDISEFEVKKINEYIQQNKRQRIDDLVNNITTIIDSIKTILFKN